MLLITVALPLVASAFSLPPSIRAGAPHRAAAVRMFELPDSKAEDVVITSITRSKAAGAGKTGSIVVTDGSGTFYNSRSLFNMLHDFGNYASIVACSDSTANAKKMLMSRAGRYSGLTDVLSFHEGAPAGAFEGAETWLAINPDEAELEAQIDAAAAAGVARIFLLLPSALTEVGALEERLGGSAIEFTVMRTGPLVEEGSGGGLKLGPVDQPVCEEVPKEDVFRFVTEALTLPEASKRVFSLCPSVATSTQLKQMRLCGYDRREEVQALLAGHVREQEEATGEATAVGDEEEAELVMRSEAELEAERAEELAALLERARQRGVETQARLEYEAQEKAARRKEQEKYYQAPTNADGGDDDVTIPDAPPPVDPNKGQ